MKNAYVEKSSEYNRSDLANDLATISCYAAGEIDNFILGRSEDFLDLKRLVGIIERNMIQPYKSSPESYLIDPDTELAMNLAFEDFNPAMRTSLKTIDQLVVESEKFKEKLESLLKQPQMIKKPELENLRSFCIKLSKNALGCEDPLDEIDIELL